MAAGYYEAKLNSEKLFQVYDTALPRLRQYFEAEIEFVRERIKSTDIVLEIAAGYGRIVRELAPYATRVLGTDISPASVALSKDYLNRHKNASVEFGDVHVMDFQEDFDVLLGLQNALSAVGGEPGGIIARCMRALKPGGVAYFSTYSEKFWESRLAWFHEQARKGLIGALDMEKTTDGVIVCDDGFTARTFSVSDFETLGAASGYPFKIQEVDASSLFLIIEKP